MNLNYEGSFQGKYLPAMRVSTLQTETRSTATIHVQNCLNKQPQLPIFIHENLLCGCCSIFAQEA